MVVMSQTEYNTIEEQSFEELRAETPETQIRLKTLEVETDDCLIDFENFGQDVERKEVVEYDVGNNTYLLEMEVNQVNGEDVYIYRAKLDDNVLEVRKETSEGLSQSTHAYDELLSYLQTVKLVRRVPGVTRSRNFRDLCRG